MQPAHRVQLVQTCPNIFFAKPLLEQRGSSIIDTQKNHKVAVFFLFCSWKLNNVPKIFNFQSCFHLQQHLSGLHTSLVCVFNIISGRTWVCHP